MARTPRPEGAEAVDRDQFNIYIRQIIEENPNERWLASWETNRGCPFSCAYCDWGSATNSKVARMELDRVFDELDYVYNLGLSHVQWLFADANFGILKRDAEIAAKLRKVNDIL